MTFKNESNKKVFFSFISIITSDILGLVYLLVTEQLRQYAAIFLSRRDRSLYYSKLR